MLLQGTISHASFIGCYILKMEVENEGEKDVQMCTKIKESLEIESNIEEKYVEIDIEGDYSFSCEDNNPLPIFLKVFIYFLVFNFTCN